METSCTSCPTSNAEPHVCPPHASFGVEGTNLSRRHGLPARLDSLVVERVAAQLVRAFMAGHEDASADVHGADAEPLLYGDPFAGGYVTSDSGSRSSEIEFMQYRSPVGCGPSGNTCPKWPPHRAHVTSTRLIQRLRSS